MTNLTNIPTNTKELLKSTSPTYWYDTDTDNYYLFDKKSESWVLTTECPFDPKFKKKIKEDKMGRIEKKLDAILDKLDIDA